MDLHEAVDLLRDAVAGGGPSWADLGAGDGVFTCALVELLGPMATIYAVDRDAHAVERLRHVASAASPRVVPIRGDFTRDLALPLKDGAALDGILLANALHFVEDAERVLARLVGLLRPDGRVVLVEYDRRERSRWVPYPVGLERLPSLAAAGGLSEFRVTAHRPSLYSGTLYAAVALRSEEG